jgi:hypothetical protein
MKIPEKTRTCPQFLMRVQAEIVKGITVILNFPWDIIDRFGRETWRRADFRGISYNHLRNLFLRKLLNGSQYR